MNRLIAFALLTMVLVLGFAGPVYCAEPSVVPTVADRKAEVGRLYVLGAGLEAFSNATYAGTPAGSFMKSLLKQAGVRIQVGALEVSGRVSHDPATAFMQGFVVGL